MSAHFLCKYYTVKGGGQDGAAVFLLLLHPESGQKRADTDSCGAQVIYFINLQAGVNFAGFSQNIIDLVGGDGVQAAAEGI